MTPRFHSVSSQQVRALARGTTSEADLALLASGQASKCLSMLAVIVRDAEDQRHPEAGTAAAAWQLLAQVQREAPRAFSEVIGFPSVNAWAGSLAVGKQQDPGPLSLIAAAAAIRGDLSFTVPLPSTALAGETLHLPTLGTAVLPSCARHAPCSLRRRGGVTEISGRLVLPRRLDIDGPGWHVLRAVNCGTGPRGQAAGLVIDDTYPYQFPRNIRLAGPLSPALRTAWERRVTGGLRVLSRHHHRTWAEVSTIIRALIPLASRQDCSRSLTSRLAFGSVALALPPDEVSMALTLAHEVQHAKLSALMDLVPLVRSTASGRYYAPWRPDPRPLPALLQGLYAHLEVTRFWCRQRSVASGAAARHADVEFAKSRSSCARVIQSLRGTPDLTECGAVFVDGMAEALRHWRHDHVSPAARLQAIREMNEHRENWNARNQGS